MQNAEFQSCCSRLHLPQFVGPIVSGWNPKLAKMQVSLTESNRDHFAQVSLMVLDNFLDTFAKAKELICKSVAQNLKRVSLTKSLLPVAMTFILLLSNPT